MRYLSMFVIVGIVFVSTVGAQSVRLRHFQIITTHDEGQCTIQHERMESAGTSLPVWLEWRCANGDHRGYGVVEAEDEAAARSILPFGLSNVELIELGESAFDRINSLDVGMEMIGLRSGIRTALWTRSLR